MNRYLVALLVTVMAVLSRLAISSIFGPTQHSFIILFCAAAVIAAWYGGFRSGLFSTVLGAGALVFFFFDGRYGLRIDRAEDWTIFVLYLAVGLLGSALCENLHALRGRSARQAASQQQAKLEAQSWQARYEAAVQSSRNILYDSNRQTGQVVYGGDCLNILGYSAAELNGDISKWVALIHPDDRENFLNEVRRTNADYSPYAADYRMIRKDGDIVWMRDDGHFAVEHRDGQPVRIVGFVRDVTELRRRTEERDRANVILQSLVESAPVGVCVLDAEMRFLQINRELAEINGLSIEKHIGRTVGEILPQLLPTFEPLFRQVIATGQPIIDRRLRGETPKAPGQQRDWIETLFPIPDASGKPQGVGIIVREVTDQLRIENDLRASEERFRLAADAVNGIIYEYDLVTGHVERSRGVAEVLGYDPSEVAPTAAWWAEIMHPDDYQRLQSFAHSEAESSKIVQHYRLRHKDGRWLYVEDRAVLQRDAAGRLVRMVGCTMDVSARTEAQQRILQEQERLSFIVQACGLGLWTNPLPLGQLQWNGQVKEHFHLPQDAPVPTIEEFYALLHPNDREATRAAVEEAIATSRLFDVEYRTVCPRSGAIKWIRAVGRTSPGGKEGPARFSGITLDVTARREAQEQLQEANRRKDEFLATLAHELRNPLAPIRNGIEVMKLAGDDSAAIEQSRSMIARQIDQMTHLIDDLMDLARITRGKIVLQKARLQLQDALRNALETSRPLIESQQHQLMVDMPAEPIWVDGDLTRLSQIFANLLNNAAKYTDAGGCIRLRVERHVDEAMIQVVDNGLGIPPAMLPRVFEMFTQVDRSLERAQGGLGIGLNLVKRLVEKHGGSVVAESPGHGQGSRFTVRLPVLAPLAAPPVHESNGRSHGICRRRILVVDDNRDGATSLAMMLRILGNETKTAHDGLEAIALAETFLPEVVLMDIGMPRLNGYDACRRIREQPWGKGMLLLAQTGWGQDEDKRKSLDAGFDGHLTKPIDPAELEKQLVELRPARG